MESLITTRSLFITIAIFAAFLLPQKTFAAGGTVTGKLVDSTTKAGVSGVSCQVHTFDWSKSAWGTTSSDGSLTITDAPTGDVVLDCFVPQSSSYAEPAPTFINVKEGQTTDFGTIELSSPNITVVVTGTGNIPQQGVAMALHSEDWKWQNFRQTDSTGTAKLSTGTKTGKFFIEFFIGKSTTTQAPPETITFTINTAGEKKTFNAAPATPSVVATIKDPDGNAIEGAGCNLSNDNFSQNAHAMSNSAGVCTIGSVPTGTYTLIVNPPYFDTGKTYTFNPQTVSVTKGQTTTVTVTATLPSKTIAGTVTSGTTTTSGVKIAATPITDAKIDCWSTKGFGFASTKVDTNGAFTLTVSGGRWECIVMNQKGHGGFVPTDGKGKEGDQKPGEQPGQQPEQKPGEQPGQQPGQQSQNVRIQDEKTPTSAQWGYLQPPQVCNFAQDNTQETCTLNFTVSVFDAKIIGKISPVPTQNEFMMVNAFGFSKGEKFGGFGGNFGTVNADGTFAITVASGKYNVVVFAENYGSPETSVEVKSNETKDIGTITLIPKDVTVTGTVVDKNGTPIQYAFVNCFPQFDSGTHGFGFDETDETGLFSLKTTAGKWFCGAMPDFGGKSNITYISSQPPQKLTAEAKQTYTMNFTMVPATATISGVIQDTDGNTVKDLFGFVEARRAGAAAETGPAFLMGGLGAPVQNGTFKIKAPGEETLKLTLFLPPNSDYTATSSIEVKTVSNETSSGNVITVAPNNATISIQFVKNDGTKVTADDLQKPIFIHASNSAGGNTFATTSTGTATMEVSAGKWIVTYSADPSENFFNAEGAEVTTVANQTVSVDLLLYEAQKTLSGRLIGPDGPIENARVTVKPNLDSELGKVLDKTTDRGVLTGSDGTFDITVTDGLNLSYELVTYLPSSESDLIPPVKQEIDASTTSDANLGDLTFTTSDASISGTTEPNATVEGWSESGRYVSTTADATGNYELPVASGDTYHVNASVDSDTENSTQTSAEEAVEVPAGTSDVTQDLPTEETTALADAESTTIDTTNTGSIETEDGVTIMAPARSLTSSEGNVTLNVTPSQSQAPDTPFEQPLPGTVMNIDALNASNGSEISELASRITVTLPYDESTIPAGMQPEDIRANVFDDSTGTWTVVSGTSCDETTSTCTFTTDHLSLYALSVPQITQTEKDAPSKDVTREKRNLLMVPASAGGPNVRVVDEQGKQKASFFAYSEDSRGGFVALQSDFNNDGKHEIVTVPGAGFGPHLRIFKNDGTFLEDVFVYDETFRGGLQLTLGDIDGDGVDEIIVAPDDKGSANIRVYEFNYDKKKITLKDWYFAYQEEYRNGVNIVTGDVDGDGDHEIIVSTHPGGGPNVRIYGWNGDKKNFGLMTWSMVYDEGFKGGVNVTTGDVDGDSKAEIIVSPMMGGPNVRVYSYDAKKKTLKLDTWTFVYDEGFKGGVQVATGDVNGDGDAEIVAVPRSLGSANLRIYNIKSNKFSLLDWEMAYDEGYKGGTNMTTLDIDGDSMAEVVVAPRTGSPNVRIYDVNGSSIKLKTWFWAFAESFKGGVNLGR